MAAEDLLRKLGLGLRASLPVAKKYTPLSGILHSVLRKKEKPGLQGLKLI